MSSATTGDHNGTVGAGAPLSRRLRLALRDTQTAVGATIVGILAIVAIVGPFVVPHDPVAQDLTRPLQGPSLAHPFGTDPLGRDMLARIVYGARLSLAIAFAVTLVRLVVGILVGVVAGYVGGWVDESLMRLVDLLFAFPGIVLALVIAGIAGPSLRNVMLALAVVGWGTYARVVRSSVLSAREREYVAASRLAGTGHGRVVADHVLPNVLGPVIVLATLDTGKVVLATAGLSFLGLGAQPPTPEWGTMIATGRDYLQTASWLVNIPGLAIAATVFGFTLLGDGLRDALDPTGATEQGCDG
ncbi:ABC-type transport system permease protein (probable substrate dipeptide/oligopeptide) [Natronomonas pharaonis DSM 2160]|uniref:ABC-type transport system permease protein (Probable substrate dipeptide/oligopeptide) n=1 Tax=Natronomonas pharaonis (strain ATCC 35678 / DSM 2160 / CIP 103997 / JCM 8858 / NBRC 14720 / NCIMB 2260 / Gabara) TaxID=348780 RepID=A0A1U7EXI0_NATPD|nr:nickel transporter permease [Natronomonas pharaonis]CAI49882.1 ABC-type transport system permease protein (probable substrate dipeptide/oligopeptide) [Natronomonas pharaonis DSM 2160]